MGALGHFNIIIGQLGMKDRPTGIQNSSLVVSLRYACSAAQAHIVVTVAAASCHSCGMSDPGLMQDFTDVICEMLKQMQRRLPLKQSVTFKKGRTMSNVEFRMTITNEIK